MTLDRSQFLPPGTEDGDFPVVLSETCSVPSKRMAYLLAGLLDTDGSVLEIGTGSGYMAAVLAQWCREVVSIEAQPRPGLDGCLPKNVALIQANGMTYDTEQEYDGVLVSFAVTGIASVWVSQLKEGGRLVVPLQIGCSCRITCYEKCAGMLELREVTAYAPFTAAVEMN